MDPRRDRREPPIYERILVATDGSRVARAAVEHAISLADDLDASLLVLSVAETGRPPSGEGDPSDPFQRMIEALEQAAEEAVDEAVEAARKADVDARGIMRTGQRTPDVILESAGRHEADLIVLGTHGRSGIRRFLLGSVAEGVLRGSSIPVLIVPGPGDD